MSSKSSPEKQNEQQKRTDNELMAIKVYKEAGELENNGRLGDAINLYQQAYKLAPNIEVLMRAHIQSSQSQVSTVPDQQQDGQKQQGSEELEEIEDLIEHLKTVDLNGSKPKRHSGKHLTQLPSEILTGCILKFLIRDDAVSIERFGATCRLFFLYARDMAVWRFGISCLSYCQSPASLLPSAGQSSTPPTSADHRAKYIETPKIRYDGIFICRCNYIRHGQTEWGFNQPIHMVTYYRYIRFFKDGRAVSILSNNEPSYVVPLVRQSRIKELLALEETRKKDNTPMILQQTQIMTGSWRLDTTDISNDVMISLKSRKYNETTFHINLSLSSSIPGAWNKMRWKSYYSMRNEEQLDFPLDHVRPFLFSRVKAFLVD